MLLLVPVALLVLGELVELLPPFMLLPELPLLVVAPEPPSAPIVEPVPVPSEGVLLPPVVPLLVAELPVIGLLAPVPVPDIAPAVPPAPVAPAPVPVLVSAALPLAPELIEFVPVVVVSVVVVLSAAFFPHAAKPSEATAIIPMVTIRIDYFLFWFVPAHEPSVTSAVPLSEPVQLRLDGAATPPLAAALLHRAAPHRCR